MAKFPRFLISISERDNIKRYYLFQTQKPKFIAEFSSKDGYFEEGLSKYPILKSNVNGIPVNICILEFFDDPGGPEKQNGLYKRITEWLNFYTKLNPIWNKPS